MNLTNNNNTAVTGKLAKSSLRANKGRNLAIIVTIAISLCLITVFLLFGLGVQKIEKDEMSGRFQAAVYNISASEIEKLQRALGVGNVGLYANLATLQTEKYTLQAFYMDENAIRLNKSSLQGQMSKAENEIIVSGNLLQYYNANLGDTVELDIGLGKQAYTVTGILGTTDESKTFLIGVSEAGLDSWTQKGVKLLVLSAYIFIPDIENLSAEEQKQVLYGTALSAGIQEERVLLSRRLEGTGVPTIAAIIGIALLLLLASGMVIYSVFYISVVNNIHEYGRLRALGATRRQIRKVVNRQGLLLALTGSFAGVILGNFLMVLVAPKGWSLAISGWSFLPLLCMGCVMVLFSLRKPATIAAEITPVEALRYTSADDTHPLKRKKNTKIRRSTPVRLAVLNFRRNKKKTATTLLSLGMAGVLLGMAGTYVSSVSIDKMVRTQLHQYGDFFISLDSDGQDNTDGYALNRVQQVNPIDEEFLSAIREIRGVKDVWTEQGIMTTYTLPNDIESKSIVNALPAEEFERLDENVATEDTTYDEMLQNNGIIVMVNSTLKEISGTAYQIGDEITFRFWTPSGLVTKTFTVMGTTNDRLKEGAFLIPQETLWELAPWNTNQRVIVSADENSLTQVDAELRRISSATQSLYFESIPDMIATQKSAMQMFSDVLIALIAIVAAFGIISLVNTIFTSVLSRRQELATLQTVGMTKRQLKQTIVTEGLVYSGIVTIATLSIGTLAGWVLCRILNAITNNPYLDYTFPWQIVSAFILLLFAVQMVSSFYAVHFCQKEPLAKRIKQNG